MVKENQAVGLGEVLFVDKHDQQIQYVSPAPGYIQSINRGSRRKLQSIVIKVDETVLEEKTFAIENVSGSESLRSILLNSGLWTGFRTRPYNRVPNSASLPKSVFVTAIDTRPHAANPNIVIANRSSEFIQGMKIIRQLGDWPVHLCIGLDYNGPKFDDNRIHVTEFDGPHPAGLVGTHIHHLDPVSADRMVWHIGYQDVIAIGYLFRTGRLLTDRIVSLAGSAVKNPRLLKTRVGACINELINNELIQNNNYRIVSGSLLDGVKAEGALAYLGRYDNQISILDDKLKSHKSSWVTSLMRKVKVVNTSLHGQKSAMIPVESFDRIMPLDILMSPLLRALLVNDTVSAENLGCLELAEEDLALASFVCPAKQNYASVLRINLNQIEREG
jgi:Na+-transporting NADH:ubiquinone oxidoreductase subunit A